jgi:hypothetical protein
VLFGNSAKKHFADLCRLPTPRVYYMDSHMSGASRAVYRKVFGRLAEAGCVAFVRPRLVSLLLGFLFEHWDGRALDWAGAMLECAKRATLGCVGAP